MTKVRWFILTWLLMPINMADAATKTDYDLWDKYGNEKIDWNKISIDQKTFALEKYKSGIDYCISNMGKSCKEIDTNIMGRDYGYCHEIGVITNGLVGWKYRGYRDFRKAAEYFDKDLREWKKCKQQFGERYEKCWPGAVLGEASYSDIIIGTLELGKLYRETLKYYQDVYPEIIHGLSEFSDINLFKTDYAKYKESWPDLAAQYESYMNRWDEAKKLASTVNPAVLDSAVQRHEWFYSEKQNEVLKAVDYYYKNQVKFMIEKAAGHKNPVIANKAKEYLKKWSARP